MGTLSCGLAYMTALSLSEVEAWLEANCPGDWTVRLAEGESPLAQGKKKIEILFETRADMDTFKARFKSFEAEVAAGGGKLKPAGGDAKAKEKGGLGMLRPDRDK